MNFASRTLVVGKTILDFLDILDSRHFIWRRDSFTVNGLCVKGHSLFL